MADTQNITITNIWKHDREFDYWIYYRMEFNEIYQRSFVIFMYKKFLVDEYSKKRDSVKIVDFLDYVKKNNNKFHSEFLESLKLGKEFKDRPQTAIDTLRTISKLPIDVQRAVLNRTSLKPNVLRFDITGLNAPKISRPVTAQPKKKSSVKPQTV